MKLGWLRTRISEVADVHSGAGFPDRYQGQSDQKVPFYKVSDMNIAGNEREMMHENNSIAEEVRSKLRAFLFPRGTTIFPKIGGAIATNKKRLTTRDCCVDNNVMGVVPKPGKIASEFLHYFFLGHDLSEFANEAHLPSIRKSVVEDWQITLPASLSEQQRIVGILDEAFEGISAAKANAEKNLENAHALFDSHRAFIFSQRGDGWEQKPLSDLCDIKHGFAFEGEFFSKSGEYVLLTPGNFFEAGGYRDRGDKQKYYTGQIPRDYVLNEGDLLVAMTEQAAGLLGSPIIVPAPDRFLHNQRLGLVIGKPGVPWVNGYFFHVFNTKFVRKEIHGSASGQKVRHTSPTKIGRVVVSFPTSVAEQQAIVSTLEELHSHTEKLASVYGQKVESLDTLKKTLLHQAFSGAL